MLSAPAFSFRQKARLAISLSWIGGFVNVTVFLLVSHIFVSHVTGTVTQFGLNVAEQRWHDVFCFGGLLVSFFCGAAFSSFLTEHSKDIGERSRYAAPLAFQALLIIVCTILMELKYQFPSRFRDWLPGATLYTSAFAMGVQNATITKISGNVVRTTHLTGVITDMGLETVQYLMWQWNQFKRRGFTRVRRLIRVSPRHPTFLRLLVLYSILGSFVFGVVSGALLCHQIQHLSLLAPTLFLLFIVILDWRSPIAAIREIDADFDQELQNLGLDKKALPVEVALYRTTLEQPTVKHRAPNFQQWIDRLPKTKQVVVLVLNPLIHLDANAILDLEHTIEKVRERGGELVLGGVTTAQFEKLRELQLLEKIGPENVCPDIEFAIARGSACVRYSSSLYMYVPVGLRRVAKVNQAIA